MYKQGVHLLRKISWIALILIFFCLCRLIAGSAWAEDVAIELVEKLQGNTAFCWGTDCLVWLVHYPEDIVDPWVSIEAKRQGFSEQNKEEYRRAFVKDLRLDESEPFLLTIYNFGIKPLSLNPLSEHLFLKKDGERLSLLAYDSSFDEPIYGLLQGLVYFPKIDVEEFTVLLGGLEPREMLFPFGSKTLQAEADIQKHTKAEETWHESENAGKKPKFEKIVVDLPATHTAENDDKETGMKEEKAPEETTSSEEEDVAGESDKIVVPRIAPGPDPLLEAQEPQETDTDVLLKNMLKDIEKETSMTKEEVVRLFVESWIAGDTETMYKLLSTESQNAYSFEDFKKAAMESNIRWAFSDGYDLAWINDNRVKISGIQKMLLLKIERSKVLGVVEERRRWRIVW
jgi:hypothetical protein